MLKDPALMLTPRPWLEKPIGVLVELDRVPDFRGWALWIAWDDARCLRWLLPKIEERHALDVRGWTLSWIEPLEAAIRDGTRAGELRWRSLSKVLPSKLSELACKISRRKA